MNIYESEEWKALNLSILSRDNFTCQNHECNTFNPAIGSVQLISPINGELEIHEYENNNQSIYKINSQYTGITLEIDFGRGLWLVTPILQVHHKRYIEGKKIWEYADDDLITYCKECHTDYHKNYKIDIYNSSGADVLRSQYCDVKYVDSDKYREHNFKPWTFIDKDSMEYSQALVIKPSLKYYVFKYEFNNDEIKNNARIMLEDFFITYLPSYKLY